VGIQKRQIEGYRGIHLFLWNLKDEVKFVTIVWFDSIETVREKTMGWLLSRTRPEFCFLVSKNACNTTKSTPR